MTNRIGQAYLEEAAFEPLFDLRVRCLDMPTEWDSALENGVAVSTHTIKGKVHVVAATFDAATTAGLGSLLGVADATEAVFPFGAEVSLRAHEDVEGLVVLCDALSPPSADGEAAAPLPGFQDARFIRTVAHILDWQDTGPHTVNQAVGFNPQDVDLANVQQLIGPTFSVSLAEQTYLLARRRYNSSRLDTNPQQGESHGI